MTNLGLFVLLLSFLFFHRLQSRDGNGNSLVITVADADIDGFDTRLLGGSLGIAVELLHELANEIINLLRTQLTVTVGAPVSLFRISMSLRGAPAPLPATPRALKTASLADQRPAKLARGLGAALQ